MNEYSINRFFYIIDYKLVDGCRYNWKCYGDNAWSVEYSGENCYDNIAHEVVAVFDRKTLIIYEVVCYDYIREVNYRWIHPDYIDKVNNEAKERKVDNSIAYNNIKFTEISSFEEWESKTREIIDNYEQETP